MASPSPFLIDYATTAQDLKDVAELFLEYTQGLGIDLSYQSFDEELANLPGKYALPTGALLIARATEHATAAPGKPIGCAAIRPLPIAKIDTETRDETAKRCELKRLYVRADARGTGLGETLARRAVSEAMALGYTEMVMDTLESMTQARRLYTKLGFAETTAYYETPIVETIFYRRSWADAAERA
ncbi:gnat family [Ophiostoma piceae UAMH 11346]|uniref:Gnat family n=1 Tax=Ophiostoma piceae (strain UAMH 11346) TaxID=1262450 RepID=S3CIU6_OPHP1|nr:gnat family [Ophiostoma piceae UAMH 11346]